MKFSFFFFILLIQLCPIIGMERERALISLSTVDSLALKSLLKGGLRTLRPANAWENEEPFKTAVKNFWSDIALIGTQQLGGLFARLLEREPDDSKKRGILCCYLASVYLELENVKAAYSYLEKAGQQNDDVQGKSLAQFILALSYDRGINVARNGQQAQLCYRQVVANIDQVREFSRKRLQDLDHEVQSVVIEEVETTSPMVGGTQENVLHIDAVDDEGMTALHHAAIEGNVIKVKELLRRKASIDLRDEKAKTALHRAAAKGHIEVVQLLLESGANIHAKDKKGRRPLHRAAGGGHSSSS